MKLIDVFGLSIIVIGIVMTILLYRATFGPGVETKDFKIQEIPNQPPHGTPQNRRLKWLDL